MKFQSKLAIVLALFLCLAVVVTMALRIGVPDSPVGAQQQATMLPAPTGTATAEPAGPLPESGESVRNELPALLAAGRFEEAIEEYDRSLGGLDDRDTVRGRATILAYASELIEQERVVRAEELLRHYTDLFFQDIEATLLLADALSTQGLLAEGLEYLLQARNMAFTEEQVAWMDRKLIIAARTYSEELKSYEDWHGVVAVYQTLYNQYPDNGEFSLELARAVAAVGRPYEAYSLAQQLRLNPEYQQRAEDYLKTLQPELEKSYAAGTERDAPLEIPLLQHGNHYSIAANVDGADVELLLDTGASITTLKPEIIRRISARSSNRTITLQTANGSTQSRLYRVRRFSLGTVELHNFELASVPLTGMNDIDGLLGIDFLRLFHYTINNQTDTLVLAPVQVAADPAGDPG